ncbi:hypothetical protein ACTFIW_000182 [Dictyostelium discoideum]
MYRNRILFFHILFSLLCLVNGQFQLTDLSSNTDKIKYFESDGSTCNFKIPILANGSGTLNFLSENTIPAQWFPYSYSTGSKTLFLIEFSSIKKGEKEFTISADSAPSIQITLSCLLLVDYLLVVSSIMNHDETNIIIYNFNDQQKSYSLGYPFNANSPNNILSLPKIDLSNCNYLQDIKNISFLNNNID